MNLFLAVTMVVKTAMTVTTASEVVEEVDVATMAVTTVTVAMTTMTTIVAGTVSVVDVDGYLTCKDFTSADVKCVQEFSCSFGEIALAGIDEFCYFKNAHLYGDVRSCSPFVILQMNVRSAVQYQPYCVWIHSVIYGPHQKCSLLIILLIQCWILSELRTRSAMGLSHVNLTPCYEMGRTADQNSSLPAKRSSAKVI